MLYWNSRRTVFDKQIGYYGRGRKTPGEGVGGNAPKNAVELREIHALQTLSKRTARGGNGGTRLAYDLNLVVKNGDRLPVLEDRNARKLRSFAATLARFLETPVWDASK